MRPSFKRLLAPLITSPALRSAVRGGFAAPRRLFRTTAELHYFHQPGDPYSHLAAQTLGALRERYAVATTLHLVSPPEESATPQPEKLAAYALRDAAFVAERHGLSFPNPAISPPREQVLRAASALARALGSATWEDVATTAGNALWGGHDEELDRLEHADEAATNAALSEGDALRKRLGHYLGGMFYFEGEWYWGVDRLHHLESRLRQAKLARDDDAPYVALASEPSYDILPARGRRPVLRFFASLRSPYTYLAAARAQRLAAAHGAKLELRYVLPMVMRGVPLPTMKQLYIVLDAKREADRLGIPFGNIADPVGAGAERGLAVLHHATKQGDGYPFFEAFLRGVFAEGLDAATDRGLETIASNGGLSGAFVKAALAGADWREAAQGNREALFDIGLWGVPTFQVDDRPPWWGQDRLWAVDRDLREASTTASVSAEGADGELPAEQARGGAAPP